MLNKEPGEQHPSHVFHSLPDVDYLTAHHKVKEIQVSEMHPITNRRKGVTEKEEYTRI